MSQLGDEDAEADAQSEQDTDVESDSPNNFPESRHAGTFNSN